MRSHALYICLLSILAVPLTGHSQTRKVLDIPPVAQRTPVWCWAAVGEMVFQYYGVANINPAGIFQCGIVALLHPACNMNCGNCVVPAGSLETMDQMLTRYPQTANRVSNRLTRITTEVDRSALDLSDVKKEIRAERPIVTGISPSGYTVYASVSEHVALIVGYDNDDLIVNDPFPYQAQYFVADPYIRAGASMVQPGRYRISYTRFVNALRWRETIHEIECSGRDCRSGGGSARADPRPIANPPVSQPVVGRSCCTNVTRCGPFMNLPPQPVGTSCWCATPYGNVGGGVCQP